MENITESWKDLKSLFEKLNEECNYLILRNYENMDKEEFFCDSHEDIDILCDDCNQFIKTAKATRMYGEDIHLYVVVDEKKIYVDLRCVGDNYYDAVWQKDMLKARTLVTTNLGSWYVMSDEDYYYSLTYHAFLQKEEVSPDYYPKLQNLAEKIGIKISETNTHIANLISFMKEKQYYFPYPCDTDVPLNVNYVPLDMVRGEVEAWDSGRNIEYPMNKRLKLYVTAQKFSSRLISYFCKEKRVAFIWAILAGIVAQLSWLWQGALYESVHTGEYNIGMIFFSFIRGGRVLHGTIMLLSLLALGGMAVLLADLFMIKRKLNLGLVGCILGVSPLIAGIYSQFPVADCILVAQFLSMLAVRICFSNRKGHMLLCTVMMAGVALISPELLWMSIMLLLIVMMRRLAVNEKRCAGDVGSGVWFLAIIMALIISGDILQKIIEMPLISVWRDWNKASIFYLLKEGQVSLFDAVRLIIYVYSLIVAIYLSIKVWKTYYSRRNALRLSGMLFFTVIMFTLAGTLGFLGEMLAGLLIIVYILALSEALNRYSIWKIAVVVAACALIWNYNILTGVMFFNFTAGLSM